MEHAWRPVRVGGNVGSDEPPSAANCVRRPFDFLPEHLKRVSEDVQVEQAQSAQIGKIYLACSSAGRLDLPQELEEVPPILVGERGRERSPRKRGAPVRHVQVS